MNQRIILYTNLTVLFLNSSSDFFFICSKQEHAIAATNRIKNLITIDLKKQNPYPSPNTLLSHVAKLKANSQYPRSIHLHNHLIFTRPRNPDFTVTFHNIDKISTTLFDTDKVYGRSRELANFSHFIMINY